jgi:hypothetical protein
MISAILPDDVSICAIAATASATTLPLRSAILRALAVD